MMERYVNVRNGSVACGFHVLTKPKEFWLCWVLIHQKNRVGYQIPKLIYCYYAPSFAEVSGTEKQRKVEVGES